MIIDKQIKWHDDEVMLIQQQFENDEVPESETENYEQLMDAHQVSANALRFAKAIKEAYDQRANVDLYDFDVVVRDLIEENSELFK